MPFSERFNTPSNDAAGRGFFFVSRYRFSKDRMCIDSMDPIDHNPGGLSRYLSPLSVWALSFGCAVGWGSFIMPGTTFLPVAGPLGTAIGMAVGAAIMFIIGMNYHYLMNRYPDAGGTLTYATRAFGYDHGFLSSWFLILVYVAIMWANATALVLIFRNLMPGVLTFGFHYQVFGYDVWFGEAMLSVLAIILVSVLCIRGKRLSVWLQTLLALVLLGGIVVTFAAVMGRAGDFNGSMAPAFAPTGEHALLQILRIVVLAPWAFVGFESVSNSTEGFRFSPQKTIRIFLGALLASGAAYILLSLISAAVQPEGFANWADYLEARDGLEGIASMPAFYVTETVLGRTGTALLGVTLLGGVLTGLIGNLIAASRLLYSMAEDGILPKWFSRVNQAGAPGNAIAFLMCVSVVIPFFGRTAIGWIVDVNTIGAVMAYGYTSAAAYYFARRENSGRMKAFGLAGLVISAFFFCYFMISTGSMGMESYLILSAWSILGFVFFRFVFKRDTQRRFGRSTVVWIALLLFVFLTAMMWSQQAIRRATETAVSEIDAYYVAEMEQGGRARDAFRQAETERYAGQQLGHVSSSLMRSSLVQMALIGLALVIMLRVYTAVSGREKNAEIEKVQAEESNRAKSTFLSNMSHDIRTPMNAIIGYTALAEKERDTPPQIAAYLQKIDTSSHQLLSLINDVLDMSRYESGKMELDPVKTDLLELLEEVHDAFAPDMQAKGLSFALDTARVRDRYVYCDSARLQRVLRNLVGNAYKFTPEGGSVSVALWQTGEGENGTGSYELRVRDSGVGMSREFAETVFEAFTREKTSTDSGLQGTGLGMAITKNILDLMGGTIAVKTAPGAGTEWRIHLDFALQSEADIAQEQAAREAPAETPPLDFSGMKLLLVEDNAINREIAALVLEEKGFALESAENGREAVEMVAAARPGEFDAVLMDVQMPVMDGYAATRAIRALPDAARAAVPILAMTANAFSEDVQAALDAGMDGHIAKPLDVEKMIETLSAVLRKKARTRDAGGDAP